MSSIHRLLVLLFRRVLPCIVIVSVGISGNSRSITSRSCHTLLHIYSFRSRVNHVTISNHTSVKHFQIIQLLNITWSDLPFQINYSAFFGNQSACILGYNCSTKLKFGECVQCAETKCLFLSNRWLDFHTKSFFQTHFSPLKQCPRNYPEVYPLFFRHCPLHELYFPTKTGSVRSLLFKLHPTLGTCHVTLTPLPWIFIMLHIILR